jgi:hypothetical protein
MLLPENTKLTVNYTMTLSTANLGCFEKQKKCGYCSEWFILN